MAELQPESVDLVVTSPPYPMIEMWDSLFSELHPGVAHSIETEDSETAFEQMHSVLDGTWKTSFSLLKPGGFLCINIGDATRTVGKEFRLFSNHSRILNTCTRLGFRNLPNIIWRKQTNAPNKFMGSGMLPGGAYVTLEHEHILIFRKAGKRVFGSDIQRKARTESAYFWEERNVWFSDVWDFKGVRQAFDGERTQRDRTAAFPFDLAYRLISMYSVRGDVVMDPFLGTGTTTLAAVAAERNSIAYEIDKGFETVIAERMTSAKETINRYLSQRIRNHVSFVEERVRSGKDVKYLNKHFGFPVMTLQERDLKLNFLKECLRTSGGWEASHEFRDLPAVLAPVDKIAQLALSL